MNTQQLQRILRAVSLTSDDELTCAGLDEERLAVYADLELAGHDPGARMPAVERHLALCPDCRQDYQDVLMTLRLNREGEWIEPEAEPSWDLAFLRAGKGQPSPWAQIAQHVRRYATELPVLMLDKLDRLGDLPAGLQLRPALAAPAKMRGQDDETLVVAFRLTDSEEHLAVDLRFRRAGQDGVWLGVRPLDARSDEPLPGAIVELQDGDGRLLEMRTVPADGAVQLRGVPLERRFLLRLEHNGRAWEVPFSLHHE